MSEDFIAIGCDCSKGRIDVEIRNQHGSVLHTGIFDDSPAGHMALRRVVDGVRERFPEAVFLWVRTPRFLPPSGGPRG